jgi:hypothetical protein
MNRRRKLLAPFVVTLGFLPACGGSEPHPNPPGPEEVHANPPGPDPSATPEAPSAAPSATPEAPAAPKK